MPRKLLLIVAALTLVWGTIWALFPLAVQEVSIWTFRSICLLGGGALLMVVARLRGVSLFVPPRERKPLALSGLMYLSVWNMASTYAALLIPTGQAAILGYTMPVWAGLLAWIFLRQKPTPWMIASLALASFGIGLLAYAARTAFASAPLGFVVGLSAGLGWAVGTTILKRSQLTVPPLVSTAWQLLIAGIPLAVVALLVGSREAFMPSWISILVIGYITVIAMALGNLAWFYILDVLPATASGVAIIMAPIVAMATGALVRGEPLGVLQMGAVLCCGTAMALGLFQRPSSE